MEGTVLAVVYRTVLYCMCKDPRSSKQLSSVDDKKMYEGCRLQIHDTGIVCKHLFFSLEVRSLLVGAHIREDFEKWVANFVRGLSYLYVWHNC